MDPLSFSHPSGRTVRVDAVKIDRTYAGVLEGRPTPSQILAAFQMVREKAWGPRATLQLPPTVTDGRLPEFQVAVWLNSYEEIRDGCGSELVLVWYTDSPDLIKDLEKLLPTVDWNAHAADWNP